MPNSFESFCQLLTAYYWQSENLDGSPIMLMMTVPVKSDLFCNVCSDFAPDLLFCSSVPGVRVLREPTVPPQWLAAFCSSALRSPWPPVITRTLPTSPAQKLLRFIWGQRWRCFGLPVVFPISNYCLVCYAAADRDAKWCREMLGRPQEEGTTLLCCCVREKIIPDTCCMLSMTQSLCISREYFEYY